MSRREEARSEVGEKGGSRWMDRGGGRIERRMDKGGDGRKGGGKMRKEEGQE